jgi:hypothetical protein
MLKDSTTTVIALSASVSVGLSCMPRRSVRGYRKVEWKTDRKTRRVNKGRKGSVTHGLISSNSLGASISGWRWYFLITYGSSSSSWEYHWYQCQPHGEKNSTRAGARY